MSGRGPYARLKIGYLPKNCPVHDHGKDDETRPDRSDPTRPTDWPTDIYIYVYVYICIYTYMYRDMYIYLFFMCRAGYPIIIHTNGWKTARDRAKPSVSHAKRKPTMMGMSLTIDTKLRQLLKTIVFILWSQVRPKNLEKKLVFQSHCIVIVTNLRQ